MRPTYSCISENKIRVASEAFSTMLLFVDADKKMCEFYGEKSLMKLIL